jgi:alkylated DNA repair dioxygenase AlkB
MRQQELFSSSADAVTEPPVLSVPGFSLVLHYISEDEERELIARIDAEPWKHDWRRRIQQYGLGYSAGVGRAPTWLRDFPAWLRPLAERVSKDAFDRLAENCVINEYIPPLGIAPHKDYGAFGPIVACVSLGSDVVMDFSEPEKKLRVPMHVPARSFWKIEGEARSKWLHGIAPRLSDLIAGEKRLRERRISITFRTGAAPGPLLTR